MESDGHRPRPAIGPGAEIPAPLREALLHAQENEITEYHIYRNLAEATADAHNRDVLNRIAEEERRHYGFWKGYTQQEVEPDRAKVSRYVAIARVLGLTFGIKLMEQGEEQAQVAYARIAQDIPEAARIREDEDAHEDELIGMIDEERLKYVGSVVLGLNDALVELTGMLAGLTLALQNTRLIGMTGLITGIAASFSMAASEYLSTKSEGGDVDPGRAALYTGLTYIVTVAILITPYLIFGNYLLALALTLVFAVLIILFFSYYTSVAQDVNFRRRFGEMVAISFGVALASFGIGFVVRQVFGIEV